MSVRACDNLTSPTESEFNRAVAQLDAKLRRLLAEIQVRSFADLAKIDPWLLIRHRGIGRPTVRALVRFMSERGLEVPESPLSQKRLLPKLVVSFPDDLAALVHVRAAVEDISPSALVVRLIRSALE